MKLVPTRVGMILLNGGIYRHMGTCPHTRGDDPLSYHHIPVVKSLSPHAWG